MMFLLSSVKKASCLSVFNCKQELCRHAGLPAVLLYSGLDSKFATVDDDEPPVDMLD
jgi:hypothetical protein